MNERDRQMLEMLKASTKTKFKIGDIVKSSKHNGRGVVTNIIPSMKYPIVVWFKYGDGETATFTYEGEWHMYSGKVLEKVEVVDVGGKDEVYN